MGPLKKKRTPLHIALSSFIKNRLEPGRPLLLALSGGPDSMALFHLLLDCQESIDVQFAVAHVDHGWREESGKEYETIERLCSSFQIPFHGHRLDPKRMRGNLEASCRIKRQQFFQHLCREYGYYAVLLGHHQDDHAETVLKRIFEGARLENCRGMSKVATLEGIRYWRPLLDVRKEQLVQWLNDRCIDYFIDDSNQDPKFLRARMRQSLIPSLSLQFGKEVGGGLASLGNEVDELGDFLKIHLSCWLRMKQAGTLADWFDFQDLGPSHPFEVRCFLSSLFPSFSREMLHLAARAFLEGGANKQFRTRDQILFVDRKRLFALKDLPENLLCGSEPLQPSGKWGIWEYRIEDSGNPKILRGWRQAIRGELRLPLPASLKDCALMLPSSLPNESERRDINKARNQRQIPAFLRNLVPVLSEKGRLIDDLLLEESRVSVRESANWIVFRSHYK